MAVTKIHRTSRTTLIIGVVISIIVLGLFFLGGEAPASQKIAADMAQPKFTDLLLYWCYVLLAITIVVLVAFAIFDFANIIANIISLVKTNYANLVLKRLYCYYEKQVSATH